MAIEIINKPEIRKRRWPNILFIICLIALFALVGSYVFLFILSENIFEEIQEKKRILAQTPPEKELENQLILYETKINIFKELLVGHQKALNIFNTLEQVSHPQVLFSDFNFNSKGEIVNVSGEAASFIVLSQQMIILQETEFFKKITLSGVLMGDEEKIGFSLNFIFEPEVFK